MRVVGGEFKGRRFGPKMDKWPTRPTTDYTKESIFNVLNNRFYFEGKNVLDLFGGTGSISLEFISRGVDNVTVVEDYTPCVKYIASLMKEFECEDQVQVVSMDVIKFLENTKQRFDFIFVDPPYSFSRMVDIPGLILDNKILSDRGILILEHSNLHNFSDHPLLTRSKKYGQTIASFFEFPDAEEEE